MPTANGFEFGAILTSSKAATVYSYALDTGNLAVSMGSDGLTVNLVDPTATPPTGSTGPVVVGVISAPGLIDAADNGSTGADMTVSLVRPGDKTYPAGVSAAAVAGLSSTEVLLVYSISPTWLANPIRQYPITLDPNLTACIQNGASGCSSTYNDIYIMSLVDDYVVGRNFSRVGQDARKTGFGLMEELMSFPNVSLQDGAQVTSANLAIHQIRNYADGTAQLVAHRITSSWSYSTETWWQAYPNYPTSRTPSIISGAAADASPAAAVCAGYGTSESCTDTVDVTNIVRPWYVYGKSHQTNYGFELQLANESQSELDFSLGSDSTISYRPSLTINYVIPGTQVDFDPSLGNTYAPSMMVSGQTTTLPVVLTNKGTDTWNPSGSDFYQLGYRWYDSTGKPALSNPSDPTTQYQGVVSLPAAGIASGASATIALPVSPPPAAGQYTLRLDLVHTAYDSTVHTTEAALWASDWAIKANWMSRSKRILSPNNVRWTGASPVERDEFNIQVVPTKGTASGLTKTVNTGDGSTLGINLSTQDLSLSSDTGLGFSDLLPMSLSYGYNSASATNCTSSYQGVLGACGWATNWDERFSGLTGTGVNPGSFTYQDPSGNQTFVSSNATGQLTGAGVQLSRVRTTFFDENAPTVGSTNVSRQTAASLGIPAWSGSYVLDVPNASATATPLGGFVAGNVSLRSYPTAAFAVRSSGSSAPTTGIGYQIYDKTTGLSSWLVYATGTSWTTGLPSGATVVNLGGTIAASWDNVWRDAYQDVRGNSAFGASTDDFYVSSVQVFNPSTNSASAAIYVDAWRLEGGDYGLVSDTNPTWTANGTGTTTSSDAMVGSASVRVPSAVITSSPNCITSNSCTGSATAIDLGKDSFANFWWKKVGGSTIAITFHFTDTRSGTACASGCNLTYYDGVVAPAEPAGVSAMAIQISPTVPTAWSHVTRDVADDARQMFGLYASTTDATPDPLTMSGYQFSGVDGNFALIDDFAMTTIANVAVDSRYGAPEEYQHPSSAGDSTFLFDFMAEYPDGTSHYFNRDGLLTRITNQNGHSIKLDWTAGASGVYQSAETLTTIHAASDGTTNGSTIFTRQFDVSYVAGSVTFTENLGTTTASTSVRKAVFYTTTNADGSIDLAKVSSASHTPIYTCGGHPSGCLEFSYTDATNHQLSDIADPRWDGSTSGANDYRFDSNWSNSADVSPDTAVHPTAILDRSHASTALLKVLSWNRNTDTTPLYRRPLYQDAAAKADGYATYAELTPEGEEHYDFAAMACASNNCSSSANWPVGTTAGLANYKASSSQYDGLTGVSTRFTYRCPGAAVDGCAASSSPSVIVTRSSSNASAGADNYADALAGGETAWTQTSDQYIASMEASGGSNPDLYRTTYAYDGYNHAVDTIAPVSDPKCDYADSVSNQLDLGSDLPVAWYAMNETSGSSLGDDTTNYRNGSYVGIPTLAQPGPLLNTWDTAYNNSVAFNGTSQYAKVTGSTLGTISGAYTVEAWVKLASSTTINNPQTVIGTRSATGGFDMKFTGGNLIHGDIGTSSGWLTNGADASFNYVAGEWYQLVYAVGAGRYTIYVNGSPIGGGTYSGTPVLTDATHNLFIGQYGGGEYVKGNISNVSIYGAALDANQVQIHYLAAMGLAYKHSQPTYDNAGRVVASSNQMVANGGFESGLTGWETSGSVSANIVTSPDGTVHNDATSPVPSYGSLKMTGAGAQAQQEISVVPGQTVRLQLWRLSSTASADIQVIVYYYDEDLFGWNHFDLGTGADSTATTWTGSAWDLTVPAHSDGHLMVNFYDPNGGTGYVDDVVAATSWAQAKYDATTTDPAYGLPTDQVSFSTVGAGGSSSSSGNGTTDTHLAYSAASDRPAIFPTTTTANYVSGGASAPDQNVVTSRTLDAWGRTLATTDADGRVSPTSYYASNQTDVDHVTDALGNTTSSTYDAVGNVLTTTAALNEKTTTVYDLLNHVTSITARDGTVTLSNYNNYAELTSTVANYSATNAAAAGNAYNLTTANGYDERGRVVQTDVDTGLAGALDARTSQTYDLLGDTVSSTVNAGSAGTLPRTTTNVFDSYPVTIGGVAYNLTRSKSTGVIGPMPGAATCPDGSGANCNSVSTLDLNGEVSSTTDAYNHVTKYFRDLSGNPVDTVVLTDSQSILCGGDNYDNVESVSMYDLLGRVTLSDDFCTGVATGKSYDAVGRPTITTSYYGSVSLGCLCGYGAGTALTDTATRYLASGKVDLASSTEAAGTPDSGRSWTKTLYDADGRAYDTLSHYDMSGNAQFALTSFESGTAEGVSGAGNWAASAAATVSPTVWTAASGTSNSGFGSLSVTTTTSAGSGVNLPLSGTFVAGHTYKAEVNGQAGSAGQNWQLVLGAQANSSTATENGPSTTGFVGYTVSWTPNATYSGNVGFALVGNAGQSQANTLTIDDIEVWDTATPAQNIPSISAYDADGHVVASVVPGGSAGDSPMVTRTGYDTLGRVTDVTVDAVAGAGTSSRDQNLDTHTDFDALGRKIDTIDPAGIKNLDAYNRLGQVTDVWLDYTNGAQVGSDTVDHDVHSTYAYDTLSEMTGYCTAENLYKSGFTCNPASGTDPYAWHLTYDPAGHVASQTPPVNTGSGTTAADSTAWVYDGGGRLTSLISQTASGSVRRHTDESYDGLGRATVKAVYAGAGTASLKFSWTSTYDLFGTQSSLAYVDVTTASNDDTITFTQDSDGRPYQILRGSTVLTTFAYNPDGTLHSRTDGTLAATTFTYDWAKRVVSVSGSSIASGSVTYGYRLDGLLGSQSWPSGETATYSYDGAKRPTAATYASAGVIAQTYDRVGDVTSDSRTLTGVTGDAGSGKESFGYDNLRRVTSWSGLTAPGESYTYDLDSNRLAKAQVGVTWTYTYDQNDQIVAQAATGTTSGNQSFGYDIYGNMTTEGNNALSSTTYAYNLADQLTAITAASGSASSLTYDALGRIRTEVSAGNTQTFGYVSTSQTAYAIVTTGSAPSTTNCLIGAAGERLATNTGGALGWTVYDLHGDIVGAESAGRLIITAFRYDPYGQTVAAWNSGSSTVSTAWRYQGRLDISPSSDPLYSAGARLYSPSVGTFTQMDSLSGSSGSPIGMNRYLYADADPATLVDPSGHLAINCGADGMKCGYKEPDPQSCLTGQHLAYAGSSLECVPDGGSGGGSGSGKAKPKSLPAQPTAQAAPPPILKVISRMNDRDGHEWDLVDTGGALSWKTSASSADMSCGPGCTMHWDVDVYYSVSNQDDVQMGLAVSTDGHEIDGYEIDGPNGSQLSVTRKDGSNSAKVDLEAGANQITVGGGKSIFAGQSTLQTEDSVGLPQPEATTTGFGFADMFENTTTITPKEGPSAELTVDATFHVEQAWPKLDGPRMPKVTVPAINMSPAEQSALIEGAAISAVLVTGSACIFSGLCELAGA